MVLEFGLLSSKLFSSSNATGVGMGTPEVTKITYEDSEGFIGPLKLLNTMAFELVEDVDIASGDYNNTGLSGCNSYLLYYRLKNVGANMVLRLKLNGLGTNIYDWTEYGGAGNITAINGSSFYLITVFPSGIEHAGIIFIERNTNAATKDIQAHHLHIGLGGTQDTMIDGTMNNNSTDITQIAVLGSVANKLTGKVILYRIKHL